MGFSEGFGGPESSVAQALPVLSYKGSRRKRRCQITGYLLFRLRVELEGVSAVTTVAASRIAWTKASTMGEGFW